MNPKPLSEISFLIVPFAIAKPLSTRRLAAQAPLADCLRRHDTPTTSAWKQADRMACYDRHHQWL
jgi:hypothetical protein